MSHRVSRRRFLQTSAATAGIAGLYPGAMALAQATASMGASVLKIGTGAPVAIPADFIGLSYEVMQLEDPGFFSPKNSGLVQQFRAIATHGVLRLGGNTSEFSWWKGKATDTAPTRVAGPVDPGQPPPSTLYAVTPEAIRQLAEFLKVTGWTCIYGLNLGYGTPEVDLQEATYVANALGKSLQYFQIGNEVDLFGTHLRPKDQWTPSSYLQNWLSIARPVQKALPDVTFGMPDVAGSVEWLPEIAAMWDAVPDKPHVTTLSHHYYFGGPPKNPDVNIDRLLHPDPKVTKDAGTAKPAADRMHAKLRMTEGNTCYSGGKPGVSDVHASALWSAGYLLQLMQLGYAGVNLHGGSGHAVTVSNGGISRGEQMMADPSVPHPVPFYSPIASYVSKKGEAPSAPVDNRYHMQPVGLGMKFASAFAGASMLPVEFDPGTVNAVAYAAKRPDGRTIAAIVNKDTEKNLAVMLPGVTSIQTLTAADLLSPETHLNAPINVDKSSVSATKPRVNVPKYSAMLVVMD